MRNITENSEIMIQRKCKGKDRKEYIKTNDV
jgi:hypothetical protein